MGAEYRARALVPFGACCGAGHVCSLVVCTGSGIWEQKVFLRSLSSICYFLMKKNKTPKVLRIVVLSMFRMTLRHYKHAFNVL